jgi:hypothetical protein
MNQRGIFPQIRTRTPDLLARQPRTLNALAEEATMSAWIQQIFSAGQESEGNIVRRNVQEITKYGSPEELELEVRRHNFHMAKIGEQYLIVCHPSGTIHVVC